ncbi:hypothetical protein GUITHDRAFT_152819 [Guillardia theta CCMP2712]|uniref:Uncharacterized protein n=1 Tax=Guillardia theta (strain CCMP2712) TaxID=905079 RepID=L1J9K1_GUITC|nr:hypothetical protein GUITHDRAFT_152819 [Guillardia theta CCMP2712]EKX45002.1 hypothetical protein GUITHDRAFT_152819 [Guillardia theta CCMP2712]|eukprot:XP_005831982.1 hypothetical protein GUITHDRAFT_152819 [Guillardia theta CCMP2712]
MSKALRRSQVLSSRPEREEEEEDREGDEEAKSKERSRYPDEISTLFTREGLAAPILIIFFVLVWYGRTPAVACLAWTFVFITLAGAFEGTEEGPNNLQSQAWSLGQAGCQILISSERA